MNTQSIDESPLVSAFRNIETIAHLDSLMSRDPEATSWRFEVSCCSMGNWIEEQPGDGSGPRWSAHWPTAETSSAFDRMTPPDEIVGSLSDHLKLVQIEHAEAVGGPLDGVGYQFEVRRTSTVLSLHY